MNLKHFLILLVYFLPLIFFLHYSSLLHVKCLIALFASAAKVLYIIFLNKNKFNDRDNSFRFHYKKLFSQFITCFFLLLSHKQ